MLVAHILSLKRIRKLLDPLEGHYRRILLTQSACGDIRVPLLANYNIGSWQIQRGSLNRVLKQLHNQEPRKMIDAKVRRLQKKITRQINKPKSNHLPRIPTLTWINTKLLNPQNLLDWGLKHFQIKRIIKFKCQKPSSINKFNLLACNARSFTQNKAKIFKATMSTTQIQTHALVLNEVKTDKGLNLYQKTHHIYASLPEPGKAGAAIIVHKDVAVINSNTDINDTVILTLEKQGAVLILATSYFSQRIDSKKDKLKQILQLISHEAIKYQSPTILLYGDLNSNINNIMKYLNELEFLKESLKLKIYENYNTPSSFPSLMTRYGRNKNMQITYSRLDYIITNANPNVMTQYRTQISDHLIFTISLELEASRPRKLTVINRHKLLEELKLIPEDRDIEHILAYIKTYSKDFTRTCTLDKLDRNLNEFQLPHDSKHAIKEWIEQFNHFAQQVSRLRFTAFQGKAFEILRQVTKYDQFLKRDGSIIIQ